MIADAGRDEEGAQPHDTVSTGRNVPGPKGVSLRNRTTQSQDAARCDTTRINAALSTAQAPISPASIIRISCETPLNMGKPTEGAAMATHGWIGSGISPGAASLAPSVGFVS